ncbi:MAG: hypothetical protein K2R98_24260 [Gemmataceae bacterium]|nr:hypothetical protein [Gemmataceae bacterium]
MPTPIFNYRFMLEVLAEHGVDFIVIGGVCAGLHGALLHTVDLDIVHSRDPENLNRLLAALQELDAYYREAGERRLRPTPSHLASPGHQLLRTSGGSLDVLGAISGNRGYDELLPVTVELRLRNDLTVRILDLETLIAIKEETGRDKDKAALPILRQALEQRKKQD